MSSCPTAEAAVRSATSHSPPFKFQWQWRTGQQPQIESFVSEWPAMSISELAAVARIDLRQRWRRGEQPAAGDYLARFPQLQAEPELIVDLIYSEFLVREELGQRPQLGELQRQYPRFAEELAAQIGLHRALEASEKEPGATAETQQPEQTLGQHQKPSNRLPSLGPGYEVLAEIGH